MELLTLSVELQFIIISALLCSIISTIWVVRKGRQMEWLSIVGSLFLVWLIPFIGCMIVWAAIQQKQQHSRNIEMQNIY